jgi:hypothetical protein
MTRVSFGRYSHQWETSPLTEYEGIFPQDFFVAETRPSDLAFSFFVSFKDLKQELFTKPAIVIVDMLRDTLEADTDYPIKKLARAICYHVTEEMLSSKNRRTGIG